MALDKRNILEVARNYHQQGKLDKALEEYRKASALDPLDPELHNILGDIYVRKKNFTEAISRFMTGAEVFVKNGEREKAIAIYKKILRLDANQGVVYSKLGDIYTELGLLGDAISHYRVAANLYQKNGPSGEAVKVYQRILQLLPQDTQARTRLQEMGIQENSVAEPSVKTLGFDPVAGNTVSSLSDISLGVDETLSSYYEVGLEHYGKGMFKEAMEDFRGILLRNPRAVSALYYIGQIFVKEGKLENALLAFQKALKINPQESRVQEAIGDIYSQRNLVNEAINRYLKTAESYLERKDYPEVISVYQKILKLKPDDHQIYRRMIETYRHNGEVEKAVELILRIIDDLLKQEMKGEAEKEVRHWLEIFPDQIKLLNKSQLLSSQPLPEEPVSPAVSGPISVMESERYREKIISEKLESAESYLQHGLWDEAENFYREVLDLDPGNAMALSKLEEVNQSRQSVLPEEKERDLQDILHEFKKGVEGTLKEEDYGAHYDLGIAYKEMGLLDEAIAEFERAIKEETRSLGAYNLLGLCCLEKDLLKEAVNSFQKGIEIPGHAEEEYLDLRYNLGLTYEKMGELARARAAFEEVYAVDIGYRDVAQKLREIQARLTPSKSRKIPRSWKNKISYL